MNETIELSELQEENEKLKAKIEELERELKWRPTQSKYELICDLLELESRCHNNLKRRYEEIEELSKSILPVCTALKANGVTTITLTVDDAISKFSKINDLIDKQRNEIIAKFE